MTFLGIDYGTKRIGLAKANSELKIATPLTTIPNNKDTFERIREIVNSEDIKEVIIGVPVSFDGKEHAFAKEARNFGEKLGLRLDKKVHFQNEVLTSQQSQRDQVGDLDSSSAALILQSYLDSLPQLGK